MENHDFAVVANDRIQKAKKIIACLEFVMGDKLKSRKILEIGGGSGLISYEISKYGNEVTTIDVQEVSIKEAIKKYKIPLKSYTFLIASGVEQPFKSNSFDVVICNQVIEHIPKQCHQQLIDESHRILKSNGIFYIATPNKLWPIEPHTKLPFLSYLPRNIANRYIMQFKGIQEYDVFLLSYNQVRRSLVSKFKNSLDLTPIIIKAPEKFYISNEIPEQLQPSLKKMPLCILRTFNYFSPSWVMVGVK
jgi:2-polyprenyl-3-methyl-5-hydroxy-6-metoxy-1,4-benzoquinol methylase